MSQKASPTLIGVFIIAAIALAVVTVILFGSGRLFSKTEDFILYFEDSVNGLEVGAPVKFKGVRVGQVKRIAIRFDQDDDSPHVPVLIEIDIGRLHKPLGVDLDLADPEVFRQQVMGGLRARLQQQSFVTGLLFVELDYFPDEPPPPPIQIGDKYKEIPTIPAGMGEVIKAVSQTLYNISEIDFAAIGSRVESILLQVDTGLAAIEFEVINRQVVDMLAQANEILADPETRKIITNVNQALQDVQMLVQRLDGKVEPLSDELLSTAEQIRTTLQTFNDLAADANHLLEPESPIRYQIQFALDEVAGAARAIRVLADYLERNPSALLLGKQE